MRFVFAFAFCIVPTLGFGQEVVEELVKDETPTQVPAPPAPAVVEEVVKDETPAQVPAAPAVVEEVVKDETPAQVPAPPVVVEEVVKDETPKAQKALEIIPPTYYSTCGSKMNIFQRLFSRRAFQIRSSCRRW